MPDGVLLDSSPLYWLDEGTALRPSAYLAILEASEANRLFVSEITIWEIGTALLKKQVIRRPKLKDLPPDLWFLQTTQRIGANPLSISSAIALEAGIVPSIYTYGDPGDCFLIATARVHNLALLTRDERILKLSIRSPCYLFAIPC